jgi:predicted tellurium resistance membrane protein TerC
MCMTELVTTENAIALLTLTALEIVLGIDNIVFISILTGKLPSEQQARARRLGLALAMGMRILLLLAIGWVMGLVQPLFEVLGKEVSGRDLILFFVITAVGMAREVEVMIAAVVISIVVMMIFAEMISAFVEKHPTIKMLALSFLILIGAMLVLEGFGSHVDKGYIYFAMAFSLTVEMLNIRIRRVSAPLRLRQTYVDDTPANDTVT